MTADEAAQALVGLWARVTAASPAPGPPDLVLVPLVVATLLLSPAWPHLRHGVTIVHEAGHGFAAAVTRRRLKGIRLHSDTSGLTVSVGPIRGPGMVLTLLAGYPAPSIAGLLVAWAVADGRAAAALWGCLLLLAAVLVQIRNWFGLWSVLVAGAIVGAATWFADPAWRTRIALAVAALLVLGGLRAVLELPRARRRGGGASDADQLGRITVLPVAIWLAVFVLLSLACGAAATLLLTRPALLPVQPPPRSCATRGTPPAGRPSASAGPGSISAGPATSSRLCADGGPAGAGRACRGAPPQPANACAASGGVSRGR